MHYFHKSMRLRTVFQAIERAVVMSKVVLVVGLILARLCNIVCEGGGYNCGRSKRRVQPTTCPPRRPRGRRAELLARCVELERVERALLRQVPSQQLHGSIVVVADEELENTRAELAAAQRQLALLSESLELSSDEDEGESEEGQEGAAADSTRRRGCVGAWLQLFCPCAASFRRKRRVS